MLKSFNTTRFIFSFVLLHTTQKQDNSLYVVVFNLKYLLYFLIDESSGYSKFQMLSIYLYLAFGKKYKKILLALNNEFLSFLYFYDAGLFKNEHNENP